MNNTIEIKKAYLVLPWTNKIVEGVGFHLKIMDNWERDAALFKANGADIFQLVKKDEMFYSTSEAAKKVEEEAKEQKKTYQKWIDDYQKKLDALK